MTINITPKELVNCIEGMKDESIRSIKTAIENGHYESAKAWYWTHIGAIEAAYQFGIITERYMQDLLQEFRQYKPTGT